MAKYLVFFKDGDLAQDHLMNEEEFDAFRKKNTSYYVEFVDNRGCCFDSWNEPTLEEIFAHIKEDLEESGEEEQLYRIGHSIIEDDYDFLCIEDDGVAHYL